MAYRLHDKRLPEEEKEPDIDNWKEVIYEINDSINKSDYLMPEECLLYKVILQAFYDGICLNDLRNIKKENKTNRGRYEINERIRQALDGIRFLTTGRLEVFCETYKLQINYQYIKRISKIIFLRGRNKKGEYENKQYLCDRNIGVIGIGAKL